MKIAVLSDIHGNLAALEAVLTDLGDDADQTWVLGDLAAHGPYPAECVARIRELHAADEDHVKVIGGNTDRYLVTNARKAWDPAKDAAELEARASQFEVESNIFDWGRKHLGWENYAFLSKILGKEAGTQVEGYGYVLGYHAIPGNDEHNINDDTPDEEVLDSVLDRPARLGLYGHIHHQVNRDLGRFHLVNPGSVGMSFQSPGQAQYAVLTFDGGSVDVDLREVPFDVKAVLSELAQVEYPHPGFLVKMYQEGLF